MKKILILLTMCAVFFSCKKTVVNSFDAIKVKAEVDSALNGVEWTAKNAPVIYYSKIKFLDGNIQFTTEEGQVETWAYHVTNVTGLQAERPNLILIRVKSNLRVDEIYLSTDYTQMESLVYVKEVSDENRISVGYVRQNN